MFTSTGASRAHRKSLSAPLYPSPITLPNQSSSALSPAAASLLLIHPSIGSFAFILAKRNPCHCSSSRARQVRAFNLPHERRIYILHCCVHASSLRVFFPSRFLAGVAPVRRSAHRDLPRKTSRERAIQPEDYSRGAGNGCGLHGHPESAPRNWPSFLSFFRSYVCVSPGRSLAAVLALARNYMTDLPAPRKLSSAFVGDELWASAR